MNVKEVKKWMLVNYFEHIDRTCNVLNTTSLSEEAADVFNLYNNGNEYLIPEEVFELALEVQESLSKQNLVNT